MKKQLLVLLTILLFSSISFSQKFYQPSEGKALVYFSRTSDLGFAINFKYFDGEKYIGKFNGNQYMVYECDPGIHSFWALSENMSMVYAELEVGRTYFIDAKTKMGAVKANVKLVVLDKNHKKYEKKQKLIFNCIQNKEKKEFTEEELKSEEANLREKMTKGVRYVKAMNSHNMERPIITPDMFVEIPERYL